MPTNKAALVRVDQGTRSLKTRAKGTQHGHNVKVTLSLTPASMEQLRALAAQRQRPVSAVIRSLIREGLVRHRGYSEVPSPEA